MDVSHFIDEMDKSALILDILHLIVKCAIFFMIAGVYNICKVIHNNKYLNAYISYKEILHSFISTRSHAASHINPLNPLCQLKVTVDQICSARAPCVKRRLV